MFMYTAAPQTCEEDGRDGVVEAWEKTVSNEEWAVEFEREAIETK